MPKEKKLRRKTPKEKKTLAEKFPKRKKQNKTKTKNISWERTPWVLLASTMQSSLSLSHFPWWLDEFLGSTDTLQTTLDPWWWLSLSLSTKTSCFYFLSLFYCSSSLPHLLWCLGFAINWLGKHPTHGVLISPLSIYTDIKEPPLPPIIGARQGQGRIFSGTGWGVIIRNISVGKSGGLEKLYPQQVCGWHWVVKLIWQKEGMPPWGTSSGLKSRLTAIKWCSTRQGVALGLGQY